MNSEKKEKLTDKELLESIALSKKWVVVLTNQAAEIHEGLLGRLITTLPFNDKEIADLICRCVNSHDILVGRLKKEQEKEKIRCPECKKPTEHTIDTENGKIMYNCSGCGFREHFSEAFPLEEIPENTT